MKVRYSYLPQQFSDCDDLWDSLKKFVATGDFTLGKPLQDFEESFAKLIGTRYAIGVNSGTDAIKLGLRALGVGYGDEVITAANTFVATVGAIAELGATPIFVDCNDTFCMDVDHVEAVITTRTKAFVPVHYAGYMTDLRKLVPLSKKYGIPIIEDACQSILGEIGGKRAGTWGEVGAFSLHPLKNVNVWSDGGVITTNSAKLCEKFRLLRNHGLVDRDTVEILGYNSRLDTFQAVVGNWLLPSALTISAKRIENAAYYDSGLREVRGITIPPRPLDFRIVYHLYIVFAEKRDELLDFLISRDIEAKIHYPTPIYRQSALAHYGYRLGDFPVSDRHAQSIISFPCDQHLSVGEMQFVIESVKEFYA